jgi:hypothetical protein
VSQRSANRLCGDGHVQHFSRDELPANVGEDWSPIVELSLPE